ncbi:galactoside O-acetyltransferase-like [Opisthocomus hoazin]|uniref:galactoside O-acetyltransferase-like n=1 Tax=Opisthocomus hoazin TaxID=30419 RepID=UPI003F52C11E
MMDIKTKMHECHLYNPNKPELMAEQHKCIAKFEKFNSLPFDANKEKEQLIKECFASCGENCFITAPFHTVWGGKHIHFGNGVYCNFGCTFIDDTYIYVGDKTMFGPNVTIATAGHPIEPKLREDGYQYNAPVKIGRNCWIGANCTILPGVNIGDNVVIGAGSLVNKDIPSNVVAFGNPCKVYREVNEKDKTYFFKDKKIEDEEL